MLQRVIDVNVSSRKILLNWLYTNNNVEFTNKEPGDVGYECLAWEYISNVLCVIPPPDTICTTRRMKMVIPSDVIEEINRKYSEWKKQL